MQIQKFSALIVDDEEDAREMIALLLEEMFPQIAITGKAESVAGASRQIALNSPDIVFLDIQMGDGSGFDLLERFPSLPSVVIFVTAYDAYAIRAIKASACDYIMKPVSKSEFATAVNKALGRAERQRLEVNPSPVYHPMAEVKKVAIPNLTGYSLVDAQSIIRCEADGHYTGIHFTNAPRAYVSKNLSHFEKELTRFGFMRVHHKHLVNLNFIKTYSKGKGGGYVTMIDGAELEVSARKKTELMKIIS